MCLGYLYQIAHVLCDKVESQFEYVISGCVLMLRHCCHQYKDEWANHGGSRDIIANVEVWYWSLVS